MLNRLSKTKEALQLLKDKRHLCSNTTAIDNLIINVLDSRGEYHEAVKRIQVQIETTSQSTGPEKRRKKDEKKPQKFTQKTLHES